MKITVYAKKDKNRKFINEGAALYIKRLSAYCKPKLIWYQDKPFDIAPDGLYIIEVRTKGPTMSSLEFSNKLDILKLHGTSNIVFVIGSTPVSNEIMAITTSDTDQSLLAVLLLEQLYRAYRIHNNEPYHK